MKNKILIGLFIFYAGYCFSQPDKYWNVDIGLLQNHNGFFKLYDGVLDIGFNYNHKLVGSLYGGAGFYLKFLNRKNTTSRTTFYNPKVNLHYVIKLSERLALTPQGAIGYSFVNLSNKEFNYSEIQSGFNTTAELKFHWLTEEKVDYYIFGRYDFTWLNNDADFTLLDYYRKINLTSFGIGIRIKPGRNEY